MDNFSSVNFPHAIFIVQLVLKTAFIKFLGLVWISFISLTTGGYPPQTTSCMKNVHQDMLFPELRSFSGYIKFNETFLGLCYTNHIKN